MRPSATRPARGRARVNAASHDDNEEYLPWLEFMSRNQNVPMALPADFTDRVIVRITDAEGRPYMNRAFSIRAGGKTVWRGTTYADGEAVVYPNVFFRGTGEPTAVAIGESGDMRVPLGARSGRDHARGTRVAPTPPGTPARRYRVHHRRHGKHGRRDPAAPRRAALDPCAPCRRCRARRTFASAWWSTGTATTESRSRWFPSRTM